jgi:hypothetical protein
MKQAVPIMFHKWLTAKTAISPEQLPSLRRKIQLFATNYVRTKLLCVYFANRSTYFMVLSLPYRRRYVASALEVVCLNQPGTQVHRDGHRRMVLKWMLRI